MKPLDFVITKAGNVGMITEVSANQTASIEFLLPYKGEKSAWWAKHEIMIIDSLPDLLSRELKHPMGSGSLQPFKLIKEK